MATDSDPAAYIRAFLTAVYCLRGCCSGVRHLDSALSSGVKYSHVACNSAGFTLTSSFVLYCDFATIVQMGLAQESGCVATPAGYSWHCGGVSCARVAIWLSAKRPHPTAKSVTERDQTLHTPALSDARSFARLG